MNDTWIGWSDICTEPTTAECTLENLLALRNEMHRKVIPQLYAIVSDASANELRRLSDERIAPPSSELFGATVIVENASGKRFEIATGIISQGEKCDVFVEDAFGTLVRFPQPTTERR